MLSVHTSPLAKLGQKKTGGMNVYVRDFTRELVRRGIQVDVFTRAASAEAPYIEYDPACGCRVIHIPAGPRRSIANDDIANYLDEFAAGVLQFAHDYSLRYDLIHAHYWLSGVVAGKLRAAWGPIPIVQMYHTLGHMKNQIAQSPAELAAPVRLMGEAHAARVADILVAATPAEESQLVELYGADPAKIEVIPPGVDLSRFEPIRPCVARRRLGLPANKRLVLFVGRIEPLKGVDSLLQATAILKERQPDLMTGVRVGIIGGNPAAPDAELARLQTLHAQLQLDSTAEFLGAKDQSLLPDYYAAADLVVMPSRYESFGMVALEAMAVGTPVIASRVGGLAHLVQNGQTGYLTPPNCPQALAERMWQVLSDADLRARLGQQAREHARRFEWSQVVDRMLHLYATLAEPVEQLAMTF
ncbi:MAG: glycosyltransferase family 1 protein [Chloroflexi bacterium]|nr:MAG: glycosyltransferase family 1 protein [Chloroflexota bacterium]